MIKVTARRDGGLAQGRLSPAYERAWLRWPRKQNTPTRAGAFLRRGGLWRVTECVRTDSPKQPVRSTDSRRVRCRASPSSDRWRSSRDRRRACGRRKFRRCWHGGPPTLRSACAVPRVVWQMDAQADEASVLGLAVCLYESSVSWTFARRVERVKGFCRNMVASSSTP